MRRRLGIMFVCAVSMLVSTAAAAQRSYVSGNFVLELDGVQVGLVTGVEGGFPFGDVVKETGEDVFVKKHIGFPGYRDIRFEIGPGMDKSIYNWIGQALQGKASPMNGALLMVDLRGVIVSRLEFTRAQITEVTIPAGDAGSRGLVKILIGLTPEQTSLIKTPGGTSKISGRTTKSALAGNFRLSIEGVNTTRVSKIEALSIKLPFRNNSQGECFGCGDIPAPAPIDFPNVVITMAQTGAESMESWFQSFLVNGENDDSKEKKGELTFLAQDLQTPLFSITFSHLGIFELTPLTPEANASTLPRLVVAMYCESMDFSGQ